MRASLNTVKCHILTTFAIYSSIDPKHLPNPPVYDNLSELEVVPNPEQRDMSEWSDESDGSGGEYDSDEDESCAWLYQ